MKTENVQIMMNWSYIGEYSIGLVALLWYQSPWAEYKWLFILGHLLWKQAHGHNDTDWSIKWTISFSCNVYDNKPMVTIDFSPGTANKILISTNQDTVHSWTNLMVQTLSICHTVRFQVTRFLKHIKTAKHALKRIYVAIHGW